MDFQLNEEQRIFKNESISIINHAPPGSLGRTYANAQEAQSGFSQYHCPQTDGYAHQNRREGIREDMPQHHPRVAYSYRLAR